MMARALAGETHDQLQPSKAARLLLLVIASCVTLLFAWAALAHVDEVVRAQGKVVPSRQLQVVSNLEGGIVKEIMVRQGTVVKAGQLLVRLDSTQSSAQFLRDQGGYNALMAKAIRLQAEVEGTPLTFDEGLVQASPDIVAAEESLYHARQASLRAALQVADAKLEQASRAMNVAEVEAAGKGQALAFAQEEVELLEPLVEMGSEPRMSLLRAQQEARKALSEQQSALLAIQRSRAAMNEAASEARAIREQFRAQAYEELTTTETELARSSRELPALEDRVRRAELRAPVSGVVNRVLVSTLGGVVQPGAPVVEIVPNDDVLIVEAFVRPADIASVIMGQRVFIKLTAYDYAIYGGLQGRVEHISSDAVPADQEGRENHYIIRIRAENHFKGASGRRLAIAPGMEAEVDLLGEKRSILSYLLTPISRVQQRALREK